MSTKHKLDQVWLRTMNTALDRLEGEATRIKRELSTAKRSIGQKTRHQLASVA